MYIVSPVMNTHSTQLNIEVSNKCISKVNILLSSLLLFFLSLSLFPC